MNQIHHFSKVLFLVLCLAFGACQSDIDFSLSGRGGLRVGLENVSSATVSRSAPAELGTPLAERFALKVLDSRDATKYSGPLTDDVIHLPQGTYSVTATCGDNPVVAIDAPYYCGSTTVDVVGEDVTEASITCSVGNALVSVIFGRNEEEQARFEKFYQSYALNVKVGAFAVDIPGTAPHQSAYFRAGSSPVLEFTGILREDGVTVRIPLDTTKPGFPSVFHAADHAIVTLTLPDPESATALNVSKVEVEEATMEETIPVSWLPCPQVSAQHQYDEGGNLVGTDLLFSNSYPGMEWKAEVKGDDTHVYRTVSGSGALLSDYATNASDWPYLPAGHYTATYYLLQEGKDPMKIGSRDFTVGNPELRVSVDGYTSYSKYLAGDVDAANACDASTIYGLTSKVNVSPVLLDNSKYTHSLTTTLGGSSLTATQSGNVFSYADQSGKQPSFNAYQMNCQATFDKATASTVKDFYITGLPASFAPPSQSAGWTGHGTVAWNDSDNGVARIRLGQNTVSQPQYVQYNGFAIPKGTKVECPYRVAANGATVQTTLTLTLGDYEYFSFRTSYMKLSPFEDTAVFMTSADVTSAKANNSYGSGQTKSFIYYLNYIYAK